MNSRVALPRSLTVAIIAAVSLSAQDAPQLKGAKELFFDPANGSVISATPAHDADRRRISNVTEDASPRVLGLSYWIELIEAAHPGGTQVTDARTFQSGDRIRLHFRSNGNGHIVIVQLGSSGTSSILFPDRQKGLDENLVRANRDAILPSARHWFKFDEQAGTEKLLVLFGRTQKDLERAFPTRQVMDSETTARLLALAKRASGSKDLLIESETAKPDELGVYSVNVAGQPIVLEIGLKHTGS
jgi:hypothetical protein